MTPLRPLSSLVPGLGEGKKSWLLLQVYLCDAIATSEAYSKEKL